MDMQWLSTEAKIIHELFASLFYSIVLFMFLIGVLVNFFKMPMGQVPEFFQIVGRAVIAAFILVAFPEIMNILADITDGLARDIGQLSNFKLVVGRLGEKIGELTWSWVSVKDSVLLLISYLTFFLLYVSVYVADAMYLLIWTLLYVFSPLLIAAFTLPSTAAATRGLFQSLIEVCLWKICWSVLAALLWSFALSEVNKPEYNVDFFTAILLNVMLAFSVLLTPLLVRSLIKGGISGAASGMGGAILATAALSPAGMLASSKAGATKLAGTFKKEDKEVPRSVPYKR
jgi:hypothetical protein